jgi:class 3 adenylate cyclase
MDAAKGTIAKDRAKLLFAALVGANLLSRAAGDADWVDALRETVKAAAAE